MIGTGTVQHLVTGVCKLQYKKYCRVLPTGTGWRHEEARRAVVVT